MRKLQVLVGQGDKQLQWMIQLNALLELFFKQRRVLSEVLLVNSNFFSKIFQHLKTDPVEGGLNPGLALIPIEDYGILRLVSPGALVGRKVAVVLHENRANYLDKKPFFWKDEKTGFYFMKSPVSYQELEVFLEKIGILNKEEAA